MFNYSCSNGVVPRPLRLRSGSVRLFATLALTLALMLAGIASAETAGATLAPIQLLSRAASQVGQTTQPAGSEFAGRPWAGYCEHFVGWVYGRWASGHATAIAHYNYLNGLGMIHPGDTNPPPGALVFYNLGADGHVAYSFGGGQIITTPAAAGQAVYVTTVGHFGNYLGWSYPDPGW